jgi:cytochrome c-type protein NapC
MSENKTSTRRYAIIVLLVGVAIGIIFWGGFNTAMEATNTETFCISCHEMEANVYQELQDTVHYTNRTGVRATCPDCHVPKDWVHKFVRKVRATNELYHHFMGSIDTRQKFEDTRFELAQNVWRTMKATDSRECRNCHNYQSMNFEKQTSRSQQRHEDAEKQGLTCIDCHKGIAHRLPYQYDPQKDVPGQSIYYTNAGAR